MLAHTHEKIEFELPSDLALMNGVLQYLLERVSKLGLIAPEGSNLFVALDEAFVNAVKHGNKNDPTKLVRVGAELSPSEACFTVEDEGEGFDVQTFPTRAIRLTYLSPPAAAFCLSTTSWTKLSTMRRVIA